MAQKVIKRSLSVLKRARQSAKRNIRNKSYRTMVKTVRKKALSLFESNDKDQIGKAIKDAVKTISTAASKGIIHKNTASRNISRLMKRANKTITS